MSSLPTSFLPPDPLEFASLYREHSARVLRYLRATLRDPVEAEDVMHEVFLKTFRALCGEAPPALTQSWLLTVARTTAIDHVRREGRTLAVAPDAIVDIADCRPVAHREPSSHWISEPEVRELFLMLPPVQQEIIVLRYVMGCRHSEVARMLGRSEIAVRKAHQRALHVLAAALAGSDVASDRRHHRYAMRMFRPGRRPRAAGFTLLAPGARC